MLKNTSIEYINQNYEENEDRKFMTNTSLALIKHFTDEVVPEHYGTVIEMYVNRLKEHLLQHIKLKDTQDPKHIIKVCDDYKYILKNELL